MPVTIEKTFRFDAGHRCLGFDSSKEEALHGHSWVLRLVIEATEALDENKTIFDTNEVSRLVKPMIEQIDHKLYRVDFNPTVEGLVEYFFREIRRRLPLERAVLRRAELDATPTLRACCSE